MQLTRHCLHQVATSINIMKFIALCNVYILRHGTGAKQSLYYRTRVLELGLVGLEAQQHLLPELLRLGHRVPRVLRSRALVELKYVAWNYQAHQNAQEHLLAQMLCLCKLVPACPACHMQCAIESTHGQRHARL